VLLHVDVQPGWGSQLEHEHDAQVSITRERTRSRSRPCWTSTKAPDVRATSIASWRGPSPMLRTATVVTSRPWKTTSASVRTHTIVPP